MGKLTMGVIGTSRKEHERRVPIHPAHLPRLPEEIRRQLIFEEGYGAPFNVDDSVIAAQTGGLASRHELLADIGTVVAPKPMLADLQELREGGILWGWLHCAQQRAFTQAAIDRKLTLLGFEDMFVWGPGGQIGRHTFYKNNEMAGYCGVLHALQLKGIDGNYGNQRKAIIFSFGAVSRGPSTPSRRMGSGISRYASSVPTTLREEILDCHYVRLQAGGEGEARMLVVEHDGVSRPLTDLISRSDIIINGIFQDPGDPILFVIEEEASCLKPGCLIIDVSCDAGMGFYFAKPTTFSSPMLKIGEIDYYAVDHTPSYLWESASRSVSAALVVHLPTVVEGRESWQQNETIRRSVNIDGGVVQKPAILSFQNRQPHYPHDPVQDPAG